MGRIDRDPSASDDQVVTDRKNDFVHGLLGHWHTTCETKTDIEMLIK
jgi:hypothetical protein